LSQEDINHLDRYITSNEIEAIIDSSSNEKSRTKQITSEFFQIFKEELMPMFLK
jgi:hypothetical protein